MPKIARKPKRPLPNRASNLSLRGVSFKDALRAAMATPLPPEGVPHVHRMRGEPETEASKVCAVCGRAAKGEEE